MRLSLDRCEVRSWRASDCASLARHANNRKVWRNLRDRFPHPYSETDARAFIARAREAEPETSFAIAVGGEAVGAIGLQLHDDVERCSAEIGFWLGEAFWGRGIATQALCALTRYALETHDLTRVYAIAFAGNHASQRVLEKAGYACEGRLRRSAIKDGEVIDQCLYAFVPGEAAG